MKLAIAAIVILLSDGLASAQTATAAKPNASVDIIDATGKIDDTF